MKKNWIILLVMIINISFISISFISMVSAEVRINEVMAKTPSSIYGDSDCEWIEIYSTSSENLDDWILNTPGHNLTLNVSINNFLIITGDDACFKNNWADIDESKIIKWSAISLNDDKDSVFLFDNNSELINNFAYNSSTSEKSWQFCSNSWLERNPTPATENNCSTTETNPPQNNTQNPVQNNTQNQEDSISLDMDWNEDDIVNGNEFEIEVSAENLKDEKYNIKVWIEFEDKNTIISDRYGEDSGGGEMWKSGSYYVYNLFKGPGDETEKVNLRIRENYKDFNGDAKIFLKLSTGEEVSKDIEILEKEEDKVAEEKEVVKKNNTQEIKTTTQSTAPVSGNVIKLGNSESKETIGDTNKNTGDGNLIYESGNEKTKIYSIIGFAALCLGLAVLMIFKKIK